MFHNSKEICTATELDVEPDTVEEAPLIGVSGMIMEFDSVILHIGKKNSYFCDFTLCGRETTAAKEGLGERLVSQLSKEIGYNYHVYCGNFFCFTSVAPRVCL